jgi:DNA-binding NtrC family response regulator
MKMSPTAKGFAAGPSHQQRSAPVREKVPSVLVVDDDVGVCQILHLMLSREKYRMQIAHSVADAADAMEENLFDVYVVDYHLTDGSGLDVAELIRSKGNEAPIILLSGCQTSSLDLRAERLHLFERIEKPFSQARICNAVKMAIGTAKTALPDKSRLPIRRTSPSSPFVVGAPH